MVVLSDSEVLANRSVLSNLPPSLSRDDVATLLNCWQYAVEEEGLLWYNVKDVYQGTDNAFYFNLDSSANTSFDLYKTINERFNEFNVTCLFPLKVLGTVGRGVPSEPLESHSTPDVDYGDDDISDGTPVGSVDMGFGEDDESDFDVPEPSAMHLNPSSDDLSDLPIATPIAFSTTPSTGLNLDSIGSLGLAPKIESPSEELSVLDSVGTGFVDNDEDDEGATSLFDESISDSTETVKYTLNVSGLGINFVVTPFSPVTVGRSVDADIRIRGNQNISRKHIQFTVKDDVLYVEDLASLNGTYLEGKRIEPNTPTPLAVNKSVRIHDQDIVVNSREYVS